jgi:signal transduction histidine kinase
MQKDHTAAQFGSEWRASVVMVSAGTGSRERKVARVALLGIIPAAGLLVYLTSASSASISLNLLLLFAAIGLLGPLLAGYPRIADASCASATLAAVATALFTEEAPQSYAISVFAVLYGLVVTGLVRQLRYAAVLTSNTELPTLLSQPQGQLARSPKEVCTCDLIESVVQELRSPANVILGFSEILHSPSAHDIDESVLSSYRQFVLESSRSLSNALAELGDMIRLDCGRFRLIEQDIDAAELAEAAIRQCRADVEKADIVIVARLYDGIELHCDGARIRQALASIVNRAVKAAPPGSAVQVAFSRTETDGLSISVTDRGISLLAADQEGLMEPDLGRNGLSALSLPIARRIALLHSGTMTIESAPAAGTTCRLVLPAGRVNWPSVQESIATRAA